MSDRRIHLAWFAGQGLGPGSTTWNDDRMPASLRWDRPDMYVQMTRVMERAGFDFLLFADTLAVPNAYKGSMDPYLEHAVAMPKMDPAVIAPMIAAGTSSIGVVPTLSTMAYPPFLLARLLSTLDHVTEGRIGWNIVTSTNDRAAQNYGLAGLPPHDVRYDMADEYLDVVTKLWSSWAPDSMVLDAENGLFADPAKVHAIDHVGEHYKVRGPLNLGPSPQGRPLLVQAGSSPRGVRFAGRHADVVITNRNSVPEMTEFRTRVRAAAEEAGRDPESVKVLFILSPQVLYSEDARGIDHRGGAAVSRVELGLAQLSTQLGRDMAAHPLDEPLTIDGTVLGSHSTAEQFARIDGRVPTLRQIAEQLGSVVSLPVSGTGEQIADRLEEIIDSTGGDGFAIRGNWIPDYVTDICSRVVGPLRRRGRVAPPTPGATVRERVLGESAALVG